MIRTWYFLFKKKDNLFFIYFVNIKLALDHRRIPQGPSTFSLSWLDAKVLLARARPEPLIPVAVKAKLLKKLLMHPSHPTRLLLIVVGVLSRMPLLFNLSLRPARGLQVVSWEWHVLLVSESSLSSSTAQATATRPTLATDAAPVVELLSPFIPTTGRGTGRSAREAHDTNYFYLKGDIKEKGVTMTRKICRVCW